MKMRIEGLLLAAALCAVAATPMCMQAQAGAGSSAAMGAMAAPADVFNKMLTAEEKEIVGAAEAMPADKFNYAPTAGEFKGVRTFAGQVKHLTEANYFFFQGWNLPNMKSRADLEKLSGRDEQLQALRDSFAFAHAAIASINANNGFIEMGKEKETRVGIAAEALAHMMDHYGQMVEYLRMNGIVPPASRGAGM